MQHRHEFKKQEKSSGTEFVEKVYSWDKRWTVEQSFIKRKMKPNQGKSEYNSDGKCVFGINEMKAQA